MESLSNQVFPQKPHNAQEDSLVLTECREINEKSHSWEIF